MRYLFECGSCQTEIEVDCKVKDKPDLVECKDCGGIGVRRYDATPHIGVKVKGLSGGTTDGLNGH